MFGVSTRTVILDAALGILRDPDGPNLTLESAARVAGLSKPGLMYHFPTKAALLRGVVDHVAAQWEAAVLSRLADPAASTPAERVRAYIEAVLNEQFDRADMAVFFDARLSAELGRVWAARMDPWLVVPGELPRDGRARLLAARLAADGYWLAAVSGTLPAGQERDEVAQAILDLVAVTS